MNELISDPIKCGIDRIIQDKKILNPTLKYGLLTNISCVTAQRIPVHLALIHAGYQIKTIFSPEHGFKIEGRDGHFQSDTTLDAHAIPIISLYGDQLKPSVNHFVNLDAIIIDLPNIGSRFYTYLWTMANMIEVCDQLQLPVIILDRPNPLGGNMNKCEGPIMQADFFSFIGDWNIPIRFGLTLGEFALLLKKEKNLFNLDIQIIKVNAWRRIMNSFQYEYPFVSPSPAINTKQTIFTYPALCYLEATNISEGRGTSFPFQMAIAPWIKSALLKEALKELKISGVEFEATHFTPSDGKYVNQNCEGIRLDVIDPLLYRPVETGMLLLACIKTIFPQHFQWSVYPTLVNPEGDHHFERLTGSEQLLKWLEYDPLNHLGDLTLLLECEGWSERCSSILLYD